MLKLQKLKSISEFFEKISLNHASFIVLEITGREVFTVKRKYLARDTQEVVSSGARRYRGVKKSLKTGI